MVPLSNTSLFLRRVRWEDQQLQDHLGYTVKLYLKKKLEENDNREGGKKGCDLMTRVIRAECSVIRASNEYIK